MLEERLQCVTAVEPEEQRKQMKTKLQETTAEVAGLSTRKKKEKKKTGLKKQARESKSCQDFQVETGTLLVTKQRHLIFWEKSPLELCSYRLCSNHFEENPFVHPGKKSPKNPQTDESGT